MIAEIVYISIILIACIISFIMITISGVNQGEFEGQSLSNLSMLDITSTLILFSTFLISVPLVYYVFNKKKISTVFRYKPRLMDGKVHYILFFVLITQIVFLFSTGVGRLLSNATSPYSPIFAVLDPSIFIVLYYLLYRKKLTKIFFVNIILLFIWKLSQGWTGILFTLALCELWCFSSGIKSLKKKILAIIVAPILIVFLGGAVYTILYPLKNKIRGMDSSEISYSQGVAKLASRLSNFPVALAADNKMDDLTRLFLNDDITLKEVYAIGRPLLPSFIMEDKGFRTLSNNIVETYYPGVTSATGSNMGLYMYLKVLWVSDTMQYFYYLVVIILVIFLYKVLCDLIEPYPGQLNFMLFIFLIQVVDISALEIVVGYNFFKLAMFIFVLFMLGAIKIERRANNFTHLRELQ